MQKKNIFCKKMQIIEVNVCTFEIFFSELQRLQEKPQLK